MSSRAIERREWPFLFESLARQHDGWLVTLEVVAPDRRVQEIAHGVALRGLSYDLKGSDQDSLTIDLGATPSAHLDHTIAAPRQVTLQTNAEGAHEALEIACADGTTTRVRFRVAVLPETVDGVVAERG